MMNALITLSEIFLWLAALCFAVCLIDFVVRPLIGWGPLNIAACILEDLDARKRRRCQNDPEKPADWRVESGRVFPKKNGKSTTSSQPFQSHSATIDWVLPSRPTDRQLNFIDDLIAEREVEPWMMHHPVETKDDASAFITTLKRLPYK